MIRSVLAFILFIASSSLFSGCASNRSEASTTADGASIEGQASHSGTASSEVEATSDRGAPPEPEVSATSVARPTPYDETIPGSAVLIHLVPVVTDPKTGAGFWMSSTEITWEAFDGWIYGLTGEAAAHDVDGLTRPSKPYVPPDRGWGHDGFPAGSMTFESAKGFCAWLSEVVGHTYHLPTEAEWEAACGDAGAADLMDVAWYWDNADDRTHPVGKKGANAFGLYDMLGNVAEWCVTEDGGGVVRGGSFIDEAEDCTPAARATQQSSWNVSDPQIPKSVWWLPDAPFVGIRLVRDFESE